MTLSRTIAELIVKKNAKIDDVVDTLRKYNLLSLLPSIQDAVIKLTQDKGLEDTIRIESPFPVGDTALKKIQRIVGNDLAPTETVINKNVLGGFKARFKGRLYDGSAERIIRQFINH
jgi:F0F1-type ATP synthase delta subunit